jgi:methylmalonyl-CoA mutase cobalamin-binding domain/chain
VRRGNTKEQAAQPVANDPGLVTKKASSLKMTKQRPSRIVLAKIGLDGHDRGIKIVARGLRDAGFHVIYAGLWQPPEAVVQAVADEDADWLGISILSGAHMTLVPQLLHLLHEKGLDDTGIVVGGIIPESDIAELKRLGVAAVFGPGTPIREIVEFLRQQENRARTE